MTVTTKIDDNHTQPKYNTMYTAFLYFAISFWTAMLVVVLLLSKTPRNVVTLVPWDVVAGLIMVSLLGLLAIHKLWLSKREGEKIEGSAEYFENRGTQYSEKRTMEFVIHDFALLSDKLHLTPSILCHGFYWRLRVYPKGDAGGKKRYPNEEVVSVYVCCVDMENCKSLSVPSDLVIRSEIIQKEFRQTFSGGGKISWGWPKFAVREDILKRCDARGRLTIKVDLRVAVAKWNPPLKLRESLLSFYKSGEDSDITFCLDGKRSFEAHKLVLKSQGQVLVGMVSEVDPNEPIPLTGIDPDLFETLLLFHYTEKVPDDFDYKSNALELLKLADKFGVINLKLLLENAIVEKLVSKESAVDLFQFAKAFNCALLLETCVERILEDPAFLSSPECRDISTSHEMARYLFIRQFHGKGKGSSDVLDLFGVGLLRQRAADKGLEVDGSRETLVKRLKEAESEETTG